MNIQAELKRLLTDGLIVVRAAFQRAEQGARADA